MVSSTQSVSWRNFSLLIALLIVWAFFAAAAPQFLSARNLTQLMIELSITAILALGMLLVILPGQIDLSVGSGVGLIGGIASVLVFNHDWSAPAAMLAGLSVALVLWFLMGSLIVREKIPAFIITLGGLLVFRGLFWMVIQSRTIPVVHGGESNLYSILTTYYFSAPFGLGLAAVIACAFGLAAWKDRRERRAFGFDLQPAETAFLKWFISAQLVFLLVIICNLYRGVPLSLLILGIVALGIYILTQHTPFGRYLYAIGGNEQAAIISGIRVERVVITAFTIVGGIVALTAYLQTAYAGASTTTVGDLMELDAIAACVIGGTSLRGGRGSVAGVLFGALLMASLLNGMTLMALPPEIKFVARGLVLTLAVWMDVRLTRMSV